MWTGLGANHAGPSAGGNFEEVFGGWCARTAHGLVATKPRRRRNSVAPLAYVAIGVGILVASGVLSGKAQFGQAGMQVLQGVDQAVKGAGR